MDLSEIGAMLWLQKIPQRAVCAAKRAAGKIYLNHRCYLKVAKGTCRDGNLVCVTAGQRKAPNTKMYKASIKKDAFELMPSIWKCFNNDFTHY